MMALASYEYYASKYGGNKIPPISFNQYAKKATAFIHDVTSNRLVNTEPKVEDVIQDACCHLAELMYQHDIDGGIKSNETVGSYSVSYSYQGKSKENEYYKVAKMYLNNTGLMYRGF